MSEQAIQAQIMLAVSKLPGIIIWRQNTGKFKTDDGRWIMCGVLGCPDIIGCYRGRFIGIEVKTKVGRQSDQQKRFQAAMERSGGIYILARSSEDAMSELEAIQ